jgi:hypothetical protein
MNHVFLVTEYDPDDGVSTLGIYRAERSAVFRARSRAQDCSYHKTLTETFDGTVRQFFCGDRQWAVIRYEVL